MLKANGILVQSTVTPENQLGQKEWFLRMGVSSMANPDVNPHLKRYLELTQRGIERETYLNPHVCNMDVLSKALKSKEVI